MFTVEIKKYFKKSQGAIFGLLQQYENITAQDKYIYFGIILLHSWWVVLMVETLFIVVFKLKRFSFFRFKFVTVEFDDLLCQ